MGDIKVKGIAHTVKTYEVQGFSDSASQAKQISVKADGFALSIDLVRQTDKEEAIGKLQDVIRQIKES